MSGAQDGAVDPRYNPSGGRAVLRCHRTPVLGPLRRPRAEHTVRPSPSSHGPAGGEGGGGEGGERGGGVTRELRADFRPDTPTPAGRTEVTECSQV